VIGGIVETKEFTSPHRNGRRRVGRGGWADCAVEGLDASGTYDADITREVLEDVYDIDVIKTEQTYTVYLSRERKKR